MNADQLAAHQRDCDHHLGLYATLAEQTVVALHFERDVTAAQDLAAQAVTAYAEATRHRQIVLSNMPTREALEAALAHPHPDDLPPSAA